MTRITFLGISMFVLAAAALFPGVALRGDEALTRAVDKLVADEDFEAEGPGIAIGVYEPGRVNFRKGYGLADLNAETPITPRTMFELASVTKQFTATAILILYDRGRLSLDDDVRKYLPELPEYRGGPIRIRHLLQHTSGLPEYFDFDYRKPAGRTYWINEDMVGEFARQRTEFPAEFAAGRKYAYTNSNYLLLATIVARISKKSFGTFLRDEIFTPIGMQHTFAYESPQAPPQPPPAGCNRAVGYKEGKKNKWRPGWGTPPARNETELTVGDGGIWTNLEDMAAWDAAQRSGVLLKPATIKLSHQPSHTQDGERNDYGLGWDLEFEAGKLSGYGHDGSWEGFRTMYWRDLQSNRTIVLLSNREDFEPDEFWQSLNDAVEEHR